MWHTIGILALLLGLVMSPVAHAAEDTHGGRLALDLGVGPDYPPAHDGLGMGGVWHLGAGYDVSDRLAFAIRIGTAANRSDDRKVLIAGSPRIVDFHAVSALALLMRRSFSEGKVRPYVIAGAGYYTSWDDYRPGANGGAGTVFRSGIGFQGGAGTALRLGRRLDFYGEALYHLAPDPNDDGRYLALLGGMRVFLHRRSAR